ncbi:MAG: helix-turn-helix transcriptional regulator, partial [Chloroflexota bacterium]
MCAEHASLLIQQTKLQQPYITTSLIERDRLLETLNTATQHIVAIAPAGYGKTTLIAQWLETTYTAHQIGWVSLDEWDNNPSIFL